VPLHPICFPSSWDAASVQSRKRGGQDESRHDRQDNFEKRKKSCPKSPCPAMSGRCRISAPPGFRAQPSTTASRTTPCCRGPRSCSRRTPFSTTTVSKALISNVSMTMLRGIIWSKLCKSRLAARPRAAKLPVFGHPTTLNDCLKTHGLQDSWHAGCLRRTGVHRVICQRPTNIARWRWHIVCVGYIAARISAGKPRPLPARLDHPKAS
jgi:hypothetical protein